MRIIFAFDLINDCMSGDLYASRLGLASNYSRCDQQGPLNVDNAFRGSGASDVAFGPIFQRPSLADYV